MNVRRKDSHIISRMFFSAAITLWKWAANLKLPAVVCFSWISEQNRISHLKHARAVKGSCGNVFTLSLICVQQVVYVHAMSRVHCKHSLLIGLQSDSPLCNLLLIANVKWLNIHDRSHHFSAVLLYFFSTIWTVRRDAHFQDAVRIYHSW